MNWTGGATESNVPNGGPLGAGDNYLLVTSTGLGGPGSRLATYNDFQWAGDYLSQNVTGIQVDVANFSDDPIHLRAFLMFGPGGFFTSTDPIIIPADGLWHQIYFGMTASDLTAVDGGWDLNETLADLPRLMIRHQEGEPGGIGAPLPFAGAMGLDNITALPEPGTIALLSLGGLAALRRRR